MFSKIGTWAKENWKKTTAGVLIVGGAITSTLWGTPEWVKVAIGALGGLFGGGSN